MKSRFVLALAAGASLLASSIGPSSAADNLPAKDNLGASFKYRAFDLGSGVFLPAHALLDPTGAPFLTSANPGYFTLSGVVPLPTGAATDAKLEAVRALLAAALTVNLPAGAATDAKVEAVRALLAGALTVNLPSGAALSAKQAAPGTAGTPSADVVSVQGAPGGTPLNVALTGSPPVIHTPTSATGSVLAYTAGTTATQALTAGSRRFLAIDNESTTATIACTFGATYTAGINTAGSFTIPPSATRTWGNTFVPSDALFCVASAAPTPVTIQSN